MVQVLLPFGVMIGSCLVCALALGSTVSSSLAAVERHIVELAFRLRRGTARG